MNTKKCNDIDNEIVEDGIDDEGETEYECNGYRID